MKENYKYKAIRYFIVRSNRVCDTVIMREVTNTTNERNDLNTSMFPFLTSITISIRCK